MASKDGLMVRKLNERGVVQETRSNTPIGLRIRYVGTGAVTSVTCTTSTNLVTITTGTGEGTKTYTFATYNTLQKLRDAINADGIFEAKVVDALLTDLTTSSNFVENTAVTAGTDDNGVSCYDLHIATATAVNTGVFAQTVMLGTSRNFNNPFKMRQGHRVHLQEISYNCDVSAGAANAVRVYTRVGDVEAQVFGHLSVDAAITSVTFASGQGMITSPDGGELIVRVQDGTSMTDQTASYLRAVGILE